MTTQPAMNSCLTRKKAEQSTVYISTQLMVTQCAWELLETATKLYLYTDTAQTMIALTRVVTFVNINTVKVDYILVEITN